MTPDEAADYFKRTGKIPYDEIKQQTPYKQKVAFKKIAKIMDTDALTAKLRIRTDCSYVPDEIIEYACADLTKG